MGAGWSLHRRTHREAPFGVGSLDQERGDHPRRDQHQLEAFSPVGALKQVIANYMKLMSKSEIFFALFIIRDDNQARRVQVK